MPEAIRFQTKLRIAIDQIRQALADGVEPGVVLADAAYGNDSEFRDEVEGLGLRYIVNIQATTTVWKPGQEPLPAKPYSGLGRPPKLLQRNDEHKPVSARKLALGTAAQTLPQPQLASRDEEYTLTLALRRRTRSRGPSRLRTQRALPRAVVADRVATRRSRADQVLASES